jgi:hypothetical protein
MMKLSSVQFENVLSALGRKIESRPHERRMSPRVGLCGELKVYIIVNNILGACVEMLLRDVSAEGVGVLHKSPLPLGTQFIARFSKASDTGDELVLACKVVACNRLSPRLYGIGATFSKRIRSLAAATENRTHLPGSQDTRRDRPDELSDDDQARIQAAILS